MAQVEVTKGFTIPKVKLLEIIRKHYYPVPDVTIVDANMDLMSLTVTWKELEDTLEPDDEIQEVDGEEEDQEEDEQVTDRRPDGSPKPDVRGSTPR